MQDQTEINYAELPEGELTVLFKEKNEKAFQEIFHRYHYRLYETALAMLFSPQKAQEAVNNVLLNARDCIHEFQGDCLFLTWICRKLIKHVLTNYELPSNDRGNQESPSQTE